MHGGDVSRRQPQDTGRTEVRAYEKPTIRELNEKEVLSAFQVTVAGITWWVM